jgi:hypothetical protein
MNDPERPNDELDRALDASLARTFAPPRVPVQFRAQLRAALVRAADPSLSDARSRLEREQQATLMKLEQDYIRLRRRTLGTMIGCAFAAGAAAAVALPWLTARLGPIAPLVIASTGAFVGIWVGVASWLGSRGEYDSRVQP